MLQQITLENFNQMLGRFSTTELEGLIEKFPYFQQAHLLLAKKYQLEHSSKFDQQLQLAALYTQDRELLFRIFHETPVTDTVPAIEVRQQSLNEVVEDAPFVLEETPVIAQEPEVTKVAEPLIELKPEAEPEIEEPETIEEAAPEIEFSRYEPHTFDDWLKAFNKEKPVEVKEEKTPEEVDDELNRMILQNSQVDLLHELVKEETNYSKGLDKFIEEQIEKHKQGYVKPAGETDFDPEIITETMAKVYEMQKKYQKAIKAYEVLALKIPEKNDFFAARINYLKNII